MAGPPRSKATEGNKRARRQLPAKQRFVDEARALAFANFWARTEGRYDRIQQPKTRLPSRKSRV